MSQRYLQEDMCVSATNTGRNARRRYNQKQQMSVGARLTNGFVPSLSGLAEATSRANQTQAESAIAHDLARLKKRGQAEEAMNLNGQVVFSRVTHK